MMRRTMKAWLIGAIICLAALLGAASPALADIQPVQTRYGTLSSDEDRLLRLNGEVVPHIEGNNGLMLEKIYRIGHADVAVICDMRAERRLSAKQR